jgi:hypothetical protein
MESAMDAASYGIYKNLDEFFKEMNMTLFYDCILISLI